MADDTRKPSDPRNPLSQLDSRVGMALAFWAYPHSNLGEANEVARYPVPWEHVEPGKYLPADWPVAKQDASGRLEKGSPEGWNTQHNQDGKLENQFMVSINNKTHEITFDFKGSDAWSNWVSDFGNAGDSEFAKIQEKAQKAYDVLSQDERFKDYRFAATGHSLGGGMAQSFALKNNLDVYVYNSLPIARDTINGAYYKALGGYDAAIARYQSTEHRVHDVRTPNDIATHHYKDVMQNQYLSQHEGPGPTLLPGASLPAPIKAVAMVSGYGTLPATAIMGMDHTMGSLFNTQQGLSVDASGRYQIPEGHVDFAQVPVEARKWFSKLSESPVVKVFNETPGNFGDQYNKFVVTHADQSKEYVEVNRNSGAIEIDRYDNGRRTKVEMNPFRAQSATVTEYDNAGNKTKSETVPLHGGTESMRSERQGSPEEIVRDRIAENLAKNPEILNRLVANQSNNPNTDLRTTQMHVHDYSSQV